MIRMSRLYTPEQREAQRARVRAHYAANPQYYKDKSEARRKAGQQIIREAKEKPCTDCGETYPYYVMQFDHTGTDKLHNISEMASLGSFKKIREEISKCEVVCANCHCIRTWTRHHKMPL